MRPGEIGVGPEIGDLVFGLQLDALVDGAIVVEAGQHIGLAKLAVVKQVARDLVVDVGAHFEARQHLLGDTDIEVVRALGQHGTGAAFGMRRRAGRRLLDVRCATRRVVEEGEIGGTGDHLRRRREVAGIAGMDRRARNGLVFQADARAELVGVDELIHLIEADAGIQGQLVGDLPLVLDVEAQEPTQL